MLSRSRVVTLVIGAVVAFLLLLFIYPSLMAPTSSISLEHLKLILPGSQLSMTALNTSSYQAWRSLSSPINRAALDHALSMRDESEDLLRRSLKASSLIKGELGSRIARSSRAYLMLDKSSVNLSSSALLLDSSREDLEDALNLLIAGNVSEALSHWMMIRKNVIKAYELVSNSLSEMRGVNRSDLISDEHRALLELAENRTSDLMNELTQVILLLEAVRKNPEDVQQVMKAYLNARNGKKTCVAPGKDLVEAANELDPSKGGRFSYQIGLFKDMIVYFQKGTGAGWKGRPDD